MLHDGITLRPLSRGYHREDGVERDVRALLALPRRALEGRLSLTDHRNPDCPRMESLVCLVRHFMAAGDEEQAWRVVEVLWQRSIKSVVRHLARFDGLSRDDRDGLMADLQVELVSQWLSAEPAQEFWEARFGICLRRRVADAIDGCLRVKHAETGLAPYEDDEGGATDPWEGFEDDGAADPERETMVGAALGCLPEPEQNAVYLRYWQGWPEAEIAAFEGVSERTVRNRLQRARERLRAWWTDGKD